MSLRSCIKSMVKPALKTGGIGSFRPISSRYLFIPRNYSTVKTSNIDWDPMKSTIDINKEDKTKTSHKVVFGLLCFAPILTFALGVWQVRRLKWKTKLINSAEDRLTVEPVPLPANLDDDQIADKMLYRKVYVTGHYDYSREIFVGPRVREGRKGYLLVCPFVQANGAGDVLVERGWIAESKVIPDRRRMQHLSCPQGDITIECLVKAPGHRGSLQMKHEPGVRLFEFVDVDAMVSDCSTRHVYLQAVKSFFDRPEWKPEAKEAAKPEKKASKSWWKIGGSEKQSAEPEKKPSFQELQKQQIKELVADEKDEESQFNSLQFIDAGIPIGSSPKIEYRNNHLQYLITWFSLSLASTILLIMIFRKGRFVDPTKEKMQHARKFMR